MRVYRCYHPGPLAPGQSVLLSEEESRHLGSVRRAGPGSEILVLNGEGTEARARVQQADRKSMAVLIDSIARQEPPPDPPRILACAIARGNDFDAMLQQAVELGMNGFWPLRTARTVVEWDHKRFANRRERWQRLFVEALKQCERLWLPALEDMISPAEALDLAGKRAIVPVALTERAPDAPGLFDVLAATRDAGHVFLVGPEGGWSPEESQLFRDRQAPMASLAVDAILRTETAALGALAIACAAPGS